MFEVLPAGLDTFWLHSVFEKALGGKLHYYSKSSTEESIPL